MLFEYQNITDNTRIDVVADVFCKQTDVNAPRPLSQSPHHRVKREVAQSCLTLCDPMDCSLSGSSIHGIFQARVLEWIAISFSWIFPTQESNPDLPHCRQTLYCLSRHYSVEAAICKLINVAA